MTDHRFRTDQTTLGKIRRFGLCLLATVLLCGCQAIRSPLRPFFSGTSDDFIEPQAGDLIRPVSATSPLGPRDDDKPETFSERSSKLGRNTVKLLSGRELEDPDRARELYQEANRTFEAARKLEGDDRSRTFAKAAKIFRKSAEAAEGEVPSLAQDALYMQGESEFLSDQLVQSSETFARLQKDHPGNKNTDKVARRLFAITQYWVEYDKARPSAWYSINLTDRSRPTTDLDGHVIRVLDQIRFDDPTGRLADDATMAAAVELIRQKKFEEADEFLLDLRESFTDSEHLFLAHLLGIQCKLQLYRGPRYSELVLDEASELIRKSRIRFPDRLRDPKYAEMLARNAATVAYQRSEKLFKQAEYREKRKEFGAAAKLYQRLLETYGDTPQADIARERLQAVAPLPPVPEQPLAWLTKLIPESRRGVPLQLKPGVNQGVDSPQGPGAGDVILR
ncbi:MAG: hypothetical protein AAF958_09275 [Planctomycetota bacterium]